MAADNLTIGVRADTSKLRADLAIAKAEVRQLGSELNAAAKEGAKTGDRKPVEAIAGRYDAAVRRAQELSTAVKAVGVAHEELKTPLTVAREALSEVRKGFSELRESANKITENVFPRLNEALALTAAGASAEFVHMATEAASAVRQTQNMAAALGLTTDTFEGLGLVAAKSGVDPEQFSRALGRFAQVAGTAREKASKLNDTVADSATGIHKAGHAARSASDPFSELGISVNSFSADAKGNAKLLIETSKQLSVMTDVTRRAHIAQQLFGRTWIYTAAALQDLGPKLEKAMEAIEHSGLGMHDYEKKQALAFNSSLAVTEFYVDRVKEIVGLGLGQAFLPVLAEIRKQLTANSIDIRVWANNTGKYLADVARDFIDLIKGAGSAHLRTNFAKNFVALKELIVGAVQGIKGALAMIMPVMNGFAKLINAATAGHTHFTGASLLGTLAFLKTTGLLNFLATAARVLRVGKGIAVVFKAIRAALSLEALAGAVGEFRILGALLTFSLGGPALAALAGLRAAFFGLAAGLRAAALASLEFLATPLGLTLAALAVTALLVYENWSKVQPLLLALWRQLEQITAWVSGVFTAAWTGATNLIAAAWNKVASLVGGAIYKIVLAVKWLIAYVKAAAQAVASLFGGAAGSSVGAAAPGTTAGFARGGYVRGAGSSTSDSIPARLSHGEYVVKAAAVRHYGGGFMDAVNSMRAGAGYAIGGLVNSLMIAPMAAPLAFAAGGLAGAGASVRSGGATIHLTVGGETFHGLSAPDHVATQMQRFARGRQMTAGGTKPSWYGS